MVGDTVSRIMSLVTNELMTHGGGAYLFSHDMCQLCDPYILTLSKSISSIIFHSCRD